MTWLSVSATGDIGLQLVESFFFNFAKACLFFTLKNWQKYKSLNFETMARNLGWIIEL